MLYSMNNIHINTRFYPRYELKEQKEMLRKIV